MNSRDAPSCEPRSRSRSGKVRTLAAPRPNDIRIVEVQHRFEEFRYRAPYQFGGRSVDRVTILNVNCRVRTGGGREAWGFGSMTLGNAWAFPAAPQDAGLGAMSALAEELARADRGVRRAGPSDRSVPRARAGRICARPRDVSRARALAVPIPKLCTLVVASAFDAAIHDAYGKAFGVSCYETYGSAFMSRDLSHDLGPAFKGEYLDRYVPSKPQRHACRCFIQSARAIRSRRPTCARASTTGCRTRSRSGSRATA